MFCRKCGNEIPDDSVFCLKCGTKVEAVENIEIVVNEESVMTEDKSVNEEQTDLSVTTVSSSDKKAIYVIFGVLVVIILIVIIAVSALESSKKCKMSSCDEYKTENSEYCDDHTCKEEGCTYSKSKYSSYCFTHEEDHVCNYTGCDSYKEDGGEYCYSHTCSESGCYNQKGYDSDYCTAHQINMNTKLGNEFGFKLNSAGGIELDFRAKNKSGKEIKYIRFYVDLYNAVDDRIEDEITDDNSIYVEITGPIANGKETRYKEIIGYNDNCAKIAIDEITLVYADGTSQTGKYGWYTERR